MLIVDHFALDKMDPRDWSIHPKTGFLIANPRVARMGIQDYLGSEVDPNGEHVRSTDRVRVYRPEEEVFDKASLATYPFRPITDDHPGSFVDANNWKDTSVGSSGGQWARDGEFVRLPVMVMDGPTVNKMKAGKKQFSMGYECKLDWTPGTTPRGEQYDCKQTNIRVNHLAVVDVARGGPELALDSDIDNEGDDDMAANDGNPNPRATLLAMLVDGLNIQVPDAQTQSIIMKAIADRDAQIKKVNDELTAARNSLAAAAAQATTDAAKAKETIDKLTAEKAALETKVKDAEVTPAKLEQMAKDRADAVSIARQVIGDKLVVDGKSIADIRRQVVLAKMADAAKDYTDAQVDAAFGALTSGIKPLDGHSPGPRGGNSVHDAARALGNPPLGSHQMSDADLAYAENCWRMDNSWRGQDWLNANLPAQFRRQSATH